MFPFPNHRGHHVQQGQQQHRAAMHDLARGNIAGYVAHEAAAFSHNNQAIRHHRGPSLGTELVVGAALLGAAGAAALTAPVRTYPGQVLAGPPQTSVTVIQQVPVQQQPRPMLPPLMAGSYPFQPLPQPQQYGAAQHFPPQQYTPQYSAAPPPGYMQQLPPPQQQRLQQPPQQPQQQQPPSYPGWAPPPLAAQPPQQQPQQQAYQAPPTAPASTFAWRPKNPPELSLTPAFEGQQPNPSQRAHDGQPLYDMLEWTDK